jgi:hypothetical protein
MSKTILYTIPIASTELLSSTAFTSWCEPITLRFEYYRDGKLVHSGIRFSRAAATRTRAERACTMWHIDDTYDALVEISPSPWVEEILADTPKRYHDMMGPSHHYMIYLDSAGCFEVLAESWEAIPEADGCWAESEISKAPRR